MAMQIQENISLKPFNSFGINARAKYFAAFGSLDDLEQILLHRQVNNEQPFILGGGSNVLFTDDVQGLVLKNDMKGISLFREDADHYYVKASAGENWHRFVCYCIEHGYAGLENLSLIPGYVGASPMQNIGAYGVEIKDVFHELEAYDLYEKKVQLFNGPDCAFGYRESIFKTVYKGKYVILNVTFRLNKRPVFNTSYGAVEQELLKMKVQELSISAISEAVIRIRSSKLPDPAVIGNAGSFFKNPVTSLTRYVELKESHPGISGFPAGKDMMKLAAGWLIEQCGWKGYRVGDAGCYEKQALVLVNYGGAKGKDIFNLSQAIIDSVFAKFQVTLEREVNIV